MSKKISKGGYPDPFASPNKKVGKSWGLQQMKTAYADMQREEGINSESRVSRYISNIKLSEGLQSRDDVKEIFSQKADMTHLKLNYQVETPLPKMVKIAAKTIYNQSYKPTATPINSSAKTKSDKKRAKLLLNKEMAKLAKELKEEEGIEGVIPFREGFTAKDDEELDMYIELNSKSDESIAMEYLIREGLMKNKQPVLERNIAKSLVVNKIGGTRVYFDNNNDIKVRVIDPVNFVHSYVDNEDYSDAKYLGEIMEIPFSELQEMIGDEYGEEELKEIREKYNTSKGGTWNFGDREYYPNSNQGTRDRTESRVKVMYLQVKTFDKVTYTKKKKRNGGFFFDKKSNNYKLQETTNGEPKEVVSGGAQAIYEGYWIVGSDYIFNWKRKNDSFRNRLNGKWDTSADFDYSVCAPGIKEMENKSIVELLRYHNDQLILLELKAQQFIIKADPPGYEYDVGRLKGAIQGMGFGKMTPLDMINIKTQTGNLFSSSMDEMGNPFVHANTANKLESGIGQELLIIAELYNINLGRMKEVIGMNDAIDGSQQDKKALVGIQQLAAEGHKASLEDLTSAFQFIMSETSRKICVALQMRIRAGIKTGELADSVGLSTVRAIELSDLEKSDYDVVIEMLPTARELENIDISLNSLASSDLIAPESVFRIKRIAKESTLNAEKMMGYLSKKFREEKQATAESNIQLQGEENRKVAEQAAKAEMEKFNLEMKAKMAEIEAKKLAELAVVEAKKLADIELALVNIDGKIEIINEAADTEEKQEQKRAATSDGAARGGYDLKKDTLPKGIEPNVMPDVSP